MTLTGYVTKIIRKSSQIISDSLLGRKQTRNDALKDKFFKGRSRTSYMSGTDFLEDLISKLGVCLTSPEESIIKQGDKGEEMYFISLGDCTINIKNRFGVTSETVSLIVEGDHFGEISLLYRCPRTCSVICRNYNTMARITYGNFREITN